MKEIEPGDKVIFRNKNKWVLGKTTGNADTPRSVWVKDLLDRKYRRNRRDIIVRNSKGEGEDIDHNNIKKENRNENRGKYYLRNRDNIKKPTRYGIEDN